MNEILFKIIIEALKRIRNLRFYNSERGFEGEFSNNLRTLLLEKNKIPNACMNEF